MQVFLCHWKELRVGRVDYKYQQQCFRDIFLPIWPQILFTSNCQKRETTHTLFKYNSRVYFCYILCIIQQHICDFQLDHMRQSILKMGSGLLSRNSIQQSSLLMETALKPCVGCMSCSRRPVDKDCSRLVFPDPSRPRTRTCVPFDFTGWDWNTDHTGSEPDIHTNTKKDYFLYDVIGSGNVNVKIEF